MRTLLLEAIYHRKELDEVDKLFQEILDALPSEDFSNPLFDKNFKKIEKAMNKVFNIDCKIFLNVSLRQYVTYGMCVFPSYEELKGQYMDAIEDKEKGFRMINCHNVSIEIESTLLNFLKNKGCTGRELTAILVHEVGHKVYVRIQKSLYKKEYEDNNKTVLVGTGLSLSLVPLLLKNPIITFVGVSMIVFGTSSIMDYNSVKRYSEREAYSDSLAVRYGYGAEIYSSMKMLQIEANRDYKPSPFKFLDWVKKNFNYYYLRRKSIIDVLKKEYKETNSKLQKEMIRKMLVDLINQQNNDFDESDTI